MPRSPQDHAQNLGAAFQTQWSGYAGRAQLALEKHLPSIELKAESSLNEAMRYACLQGGKRFRATLVYACGELTGATAESLDAPAAAIEMIHAYSLVHDDLPAMDDDTLRRGQATCHIKYDEATAILVGDALQSHAFETLCDTPIAKDKCLQMVQILSKASGNNGMAGGQALDMLATGQNIELAQLKRVHNLKTGALILAAIKLGATASPSCSEKDFTALNRYGRALGLAFQVADDILDETQSSEMLGKNSGADIAMNKSTYPRLMGLSSAQEYAHNLLTEALESLSDFGDNSAFLRQLAQFAVQRDH